jgi:hypothetical protein
MTIASEFASGRIASPRASPYRRAAVIAVAHHQEQQVAGAKGVSLPRAGDRIRPAAGIDTGEFGMLARRIDPLAEPAHRRLARPAGVVVAGDVIELLAAMLLGRRVLPDDLSSFFVVGSGLVPRQVAQIDGNVPVKSRAAIGASLFRLPDRLGQALTLGDPQVRADVGAADCPHAESFPGRSIIQAGHRGGLGQADADRRGFASGGCDELTTGQIGGHGQRSTIQRQKVVSGCIISAARAAADHD